MTPAFLVKWRLNFNKFCKKGNAYRFWTTCTIKTIDQSLGKYLIVDFKNRQCGDLRAYSFANATFLKYKILTMWPRWWRHGTLGSLESKIFLLNYFLISFRKSYFTQEKISSLKKRKSRIKSKKMSPRRSTLRKISPRHEFARII